MATGQYSYIWFLTLVARTIRFCGAGTTGYGDASEKSRLTRSSSSLVDACCEGVAAASLVACILRRHRGTCATFRGVCQFDAAPEQVATRISARPAARFAGLPRFAVDVFYF